MRLQYTPEYLNFTSPVEDELNARDRLENQSMLAGDCGGILRLVETALVEMDLDNPYFLRQKISDLRQSVSIAALVIEGVGNRLSDMTVPKAAPASVVEDNHDVRQFLIDQFDELCRQEPDGQDEPLINAYFDQQDELSRTIVSMRCHSYRDCQQLARFAARHFANFDRWGEDIRILLASIGGLPFTPAEAEPAPDLIATIEAYRAGMQAYQDDPEAGFDADDKVASQTYGPHLEKLQNWSTPASSEIEALAALRLAHEDIRGIIDEDLVSAMMSAALGYFDRANKAKAG